MTLHKIEQQQCTKKRTRKKYSRAERKGWVEKWRVSQLSKAEFCRRHQINLKRFYNWTDATTTNPPAAIDKSPMTNRLLPINVAPVQSLTTKPPSSKSATPQPSSPNNICVEIIIKDQITIKLPMPSSRECIVKLIRDLSCN